VLNHKIEQLQLKKTQDSDSATVHQPPMTGANYARGARRPGMAEAIMPPAHLQQIQHLPALLSMDRGRDRIDGREKKTTKTRAATVSGVTASQVRAFAAAPHDSPEKKVAFWSSYIVPPPTPRAKGRPLGRPL
jgi:hypothetical protein